jgi:guanylate kinase
MSAAGRSDNAGKLIVISGPSGVGKSTICRRVIERTGGVLSVSATTRPRGKNETNGKDYYFLTRPQFEEKIARGELLEYAEVFGNLYGTPADAVRKRLDEGQTVILEIDVQGGRSVRRLFPDALLIFILPPDLNVLAERIRGRNRGEDDETARRRLDAAKKEIEQAKTFYTRMIVNDNLDKAVDEVVEIIETYRGESQ